MDTLRYFCRPYSQRLSLTLTMVSVKQVFLAFWTILLCGRETVSALSLDPRPLTRKELFKTTLTGLGVACTINTGLVIPTTPAVASEVEKISDEVIKKTVESDILERQFLVTGNLSPEIYRSTASFTDEIDTYKMDQWMKGTQKLFVGEKSEIRLVGEVQVSKEQVEFRFDEDLMFRIPFNPKVALTGKVILARDEDGFITSYREFWDQDVATVLKSAKF